MSRRIRPFPGALLLLVTLAASPEGRAAEARLDETDEAPAAAPRLRLDLGAAYAAYDADVTSAGLRSHAAGSTLSRLQSEAAWRPQGSSFGVGAGLDLERFSLSSGDQSLIVTGLVAHLGALARFDRGAFSAEAQLGYATVRVPFAARGGVSDASAALFAHGPAATGRLAFLVAPWLGVEATGRIMPRLFGAQHQGASVQVDHLAGGVGVDVGRTVVGGVALSGLVGYEHTQSRGQGGGLEVRQAQDGFGIGLRGTWPVPAARPIVLAPAPPAQPVGRVRGVVRAAAGGSEAAGAPLAGVQVSAEDGPSATTDASGSFVLEGLAASLTKITVDKDGFARATEVVSVPGTGEVSVQIALRPLAAARAAVLMVFVRAEGGAALPAEVSVSETGHSARADRKGRFRYEVTAGNYTLTVAAPGFEPQSKAVRVGAGEQNIFNVELQRTR